MFFLTDNAKMSKVTNDGFSHFSSRIEAFHKLRVLTGFEKIGHIYIYTFAIQNAVCSRVIKVYTYFLAYIQCTYLPPIAKLHWHLMIVGIVLSVLTTR